MNGVILCLALHLAAAPDISLGDFEEPSFGDWTATGPAFPSPYRPGAKPRYEGFHGTGMAWSGRGGPEPTGQLVSPEFEIRRAFLHFLVAGDRDLPSTLGVELVVDGRVVRAASASEHFDPARRLYARTWAVADLAGRKARLRVNDRSAFGLIGVDHFIQSDAPASPPIDASALYHETYRPQFHFTPERGWMNDPNGLLYYGGQWHLFHQHRWPGSGATAWGHAVSDDLVRWRRLSDAIPAEGRDAIFSGSGLVDWANASGLKQGPHAPLLLFYTLHPAAPEKGSAEAPRRATQCMAYSTDGGQTFQKYAGNPLVRTPDFNDRDPKVFYHGPSRAWWMVLSLSKNNAQRDQAEYGLFRSADLKAWDLRQKLGPGAWYWECPDMFELPLEGEPGRSKWLLVKSSGEYIVGSFDGQAFRPETEPIRNRWGTGYYATQTFSDAPGGRRVQIGWMNTGKQQAPNSFPGMPFNQQLSFPRELTLRPTNAGPRLFRSPVREIEKLYGKGDIHLLPERPEGCFAQKVKVPFSAANRTIRPGENLLAGIEHDLLDVDLSIDLGQAKWLRLVLRGAELIYDRAERKLKGCGGSAPLETPGGRLQLRVLLDRTSIEAFANRGEADISHVFFPKPDDRRLALTVEGGAARVIELKVHQLEALR